MRQVDWKVLDFQREMIRIKRLQEREKRDAEFCCLLYRSRNEKFQFYYNMDGEKISRFLVTKLYLHLQNNEDRNGNSGISRLAFIVNRNKAIMLAP